MNDETTQLLNDSVQSPKQKPQFNPAPAKRKINAAAVASGAGGFVAGAAVGAATIGATASNPEATPDEVITATEEETPQVEAEPVDVDANDAANSSESAQIPEDSMSVVNEEIKVAQVTADNFNDAFAQARAQVGAGGVFEYNGQLYGTYLEDEWNEMSTQERADYYNRVADAHPNYASHSTPSTHSGQPQVTHTAAMVDDSIAPDAEMIAVEQVDDSIHVLGVQAVSNEQGDIMNVALVESQGDMAMLIDIDNDGTIEVALHDDNYNGNIERDEIHDVSGANIQVEDLYNASQQQYEAYNTSMDDMPDYTNDADIMISEV